IEKIRGMLTMVINAPIRRASPPKISSRVTSQAPARGSGTWACFKSSANIAGPRLHLAHPWTMNPTPRIIRIGTGAHRCQRSLFSNSNMLIPFESLDLGRDEVADHRCDLCRMRFQREVPSVIKMHLRLGKIPLERFGAGWKKEGIILTPDRQQWWLIF